MSEREQKPPPCLDSEKCPRVAACLESSKLCHELGRVGSYRPCGIGRMDQYGLTFSRPYDDAGSLSNTLSL